MTGLARTLDLDALTLAHGAHEYHGLKPDAGCVMDERDAARDAALARLAPTVAECQESAHRLLDRMIGLSREVAS